MQQNIEELLGMMDQGKNPFESIVNGGGKAPQQGMQMPKNILGMNMGGMSDNPQEETQETAPSRPQIGPDGKPLPDQTQRGQNPGISKYITQAMGAMQNMIAESTDPQELAAIRMVISILGRLMERDQQAQGNQLSQ